MAKKIHPALETVLASEEQIRERVRELAAELTRVYGSEEVTIISIINGAILFTADLMRLLPNPIRLDCIRISSYRSATRSEGVPKVLQSFQLDVAGRHVLLIDDILDTGKTLALVRQMIRVMNPASLRTCVLLDKKERREVDIEADFAGFSIPNKFVVGYGLDFDERYRNIPCIGVLKPELQTPGAPAVC
ncbi:MAG: hypoxanthine phosphoribosyltransferase [Opitutaceae bacterium]|jgi:hypoxanthine phosphoribosyltransferase|nr:hypoxanthine phosphoribosyltransferase [Opitutaceae bacterium]